MGLLEYLRTFRRHWLVIFATLVVAMTAAWFTTETIAPVVRTAPTYQATALLASSGSSIDGVPLNPDTLAILATIDPVAERAATILGFEGDPATLQQRMQATPDANTGVFLSLSGFGSTERTAEKTSDAFSRALIGYVRDRRNQSLGVRMAGLEKGVEQAQAEGNQELIVTLRTEIANLEAEAASPTGVSVFERGNAVALGSSGFSPPDSALVRLAIAAAIGLLAGAGIALLLERVDTKIRTSEQATERFGYPVLAEVPSIPRDQRRSIVTADHPTSPSADAFRLLGAGVNVAVRPTDVEDPSGNRGRIILVTSSGPAEGKSTVVANLAAVLAEEGKRVIVFSADLRRPSLHQVLKADPKPGLVQVARDRDPGIRRYRQSTRLDRVSFVPSGGATERPGEVLASPSVAELLRDACAAADWVLLDTAPILVAGESAPLFDEADLVLVVARCGTTSNPVAERTRDTLHRLGADAAWVVLNASRESNVPDGYRRYQVSAKRNAKALKGIPR